MLGTKALFFFLLSCLAVKMLNYADQALIDKKNNKSHLGGKVRDLFHVYLHKFEFHFLQFHINKTNTFCFFMHNERVSGIAK